MADDTVADRILARLEEFADSLERGEPWSTNRVRKLAPRTGLFWCDCDLMKVGHGQRCSACGGRTGKRRMKK